MLSRIESRNSDLATPTAKASGPCKNGMLSRWSCPDSSLAHDPQCKRCVSSRRAKIFLSGSDQLGGIGLPGRQERCDDSPTIGTQLIAVRMSHLVDQMM